MNTSYSISSCPPRQIDYGTLNATEWISCGEGPFSNFECRNVTYPKVYDPPANTKEEGYLVNEERRQIQGTPTTYVFLISGGPGGNSDILCLSTAPFVASSLVNDFAIHIPSLRGTTNTDHIEDYIEFPSNLAGYLNQAALPYTAFSVSNTARDVIASVKNAKLEFPSANFVAIGFGFGTYVLQRAMLFEPDLFESVIFDSAMPPVNGSNLFQWQSVGLESAIKAINDNCQQSEFCSKTSLSLSELTAFTNGLYQAKPKSTLCFDVFVKSAALGSIKPEVLAITLNTLAFFPNIEVPNEIFESDINDSRVVEQILQAAIASFGGNIGKPGHVYLDFRVILWSVLNQFSQCENFGRYPSFETAMDTLGFVLKIVRAINLSFFIPSSPIGESDITKNLLLYSEGRLPTTNFDQVRQSQSGIPIRNSLISNNQERQIVDEFSLVQPFDDCYANLPLKDVPTNFVFLNGLLDVLTPNQASQNAFDSLTVSEGYTKVSYTHNNAGHTVIGYGWSSCSSLIIKGFFLKDQASTQAYIDCLNAENSKTLDWEAKQLGNVGGSRIWMGLPQTNVVFALIVTAVTLYGFLVCAGIVFLNRYAKPAK